MKIRILLSALVATLAVSASAQFNQFGETRMAILSAPQVIGASSGVVTNGPIDTSGFLGTAVVDIFTKTNTAGGALTAALYVSSDASTLVAVSNYAAAVSTSWTNINTTASITNATSYQLPGTVTTPTASTAGFATPYLSPSAFTGSGAVTVTADGVKRLGYKVQENYRYLYIVWTPSGTATNITCAATITGVKAGYP